MKTMTKALAKGTFATVAAGAMTLSMASPAAAQYRDYDRDDDGISAGEVIAGAVILGGLAAILSNGDDRDDYRYRDRRGYRNGYDGYGRNSSRRAVDQCVRAAERTVQRYTGSRAEVYEIRDVERERRGYEIDGRIAVRDDYGYRDRHDYRDRYDYRDRRGRYDDRDYRRGYRNQGWDEGRFSCEYRNGRVIDIDFDNIRGL